MYTNKVDNIGHQYEVQLYVDLTKSSEIVIGNFITQLTFKRLLHR